MALIDDVRGVCARLAPQGWAALLTRHGLDITRTDLAAELSRALPQIDRTVPGFEDFALEGKRGIEPGNPARSLLYHALASPNVAQNNGTPLAGFPTLRDLEIVENYVFGARPPSLAELSALAGSGLMAIVVFAAEYRPGVDTAHRKHADLCFARAGVARIGTAPALYEGQGRGFVPFQQDDPHAVRVLPARYSVWIAVQKSGDEGAFGPMRFSFRARHPELFRRPNDPAEPDDSRRQFWVPLHKLFDGPECLQGFDLQVGLEAHHVNEKLRRIHLEFARRGVDAGWHRPDIDNPPFRMTEGIAAFSTDQDFGKGVLVPVPHAALVEAAVFQGRPLTFRVPDAVHLGSRTNFLPTLELTAKGAERHAPEYVHVRHAPAEATPNLNDLPDPADRVRQGNYQAQHYIDFTGDGWIAPQCPQLRAQLPRFIPAYSLVAAPDFYFNCDQREVMDWWLQRAPQALRDSLWQTPPFALSDERMAPNLKLNNVDFQANSPTAPKAGFRPEDDTVTAIVSMPLRGDIQDRPLIEAKRNRHNALPDGAAGVFAPGWDTSFDATNGVRHLAAYGLGSPFPEDSKLCAALSTFWPAVAPDAGRSFSQVFPTVSPLTDAELGQTGTLPWDGVPGPHLVGAGAAAVAEYADFDHVDYVENALANHFSLALTGQVTTAEYLSRVLATARMYAALDMLPNPPAQKTDWNVLSFRRVNAGDAELTAAQNATGETLGGTVFRFEVYQPAPAPVQPADFRRRHFTVNERHVILVGGASVALVNTRGAWQPFQT